MQRDKFSLSLRKRKYKILQNEKKELFREQKLSIIKEHYEQPYRNNWNPKLNILEGKYEMPKLAQEGGTNRPMVLKPWMGDEKSFQDQERQTYHS